MPTMQGVQSTAAGAITQNVISGQPFEFAQKTGWCRLAGSAEAAGESRVTVYAGSRIVMPESTVSRQARPPLIPDDVICTFPVRAGERITITHRNTGAGANNLFWRLDVP